MDRTKLSIFKEADEVGFSRFLESSERKTLEADLVINLDGDLTNQPLEGSSSEQQLRASLELLDLSQSCSSWPEPSESSHLLLYLALSVDRSLLLLRDQRVIDDFSSSSRNNARASLILCHALRRGRL